MTQTLRLILPLAPSLNNAYETIGRRRRLTNEGKAYKAEATILARNAAQDAGWSYVKGQRIALVVSLWFVSASSSAQSDIDNRFKLLGDALAAALGYNDHAVDELVLRRGGVDPARPRAEVAVIILPPVVAVLAPRRPTRKAA